MSSKRHHTELNMTTPARTKRLGYRVWEFCDATGLGRTKVYELIAQKRLDVVRVGRCTIITADSAEALFRDLTGEAR